MSTQYHVRAVRCSHTADDSQIYEALCRATSPLKLSWSRLRKASRILIKANAVYWPDRIEMFGGRFKGLVDPSVMAGVLRLLREKTTAELVLADTSLAGDESDVYFRDLLRDSGVRFANFSESPLRWYRVPGGAGMFERYLLASELETADAVVSVAKVKAHSYTGVTLCMKNLFGLTPLSADARPRQYFHHLVRLPYVIADLGKLINPSLCIVDGLVGQSGSEWRGVGRVMGMLAAGDQVTATDACVAHLMDVDPTGDWRTHPFIRERNHLKIAASSGFGTVDLDNIDFESELDPSVGGFTAEVSDSVETVFSWRKTACEQALYYRDNRNQVIPDYGGKYIYLHRGRVVWSGDDPATLGSRRDLSGNHKDQALWLKYVDPGEREGERFEVYEDELRRIDRN